MEDNRTKGTEVEFVMKEVFQATGLSPGLA